MRPWSAAAMACGERRDLRREQIVYRGVAGIAAWRRRSRRPASAPRSRRRATAMRRCSAPDRRRCRAGAPRTAATCARPCRARRDRCCIPGPVQPRAGFPERQHQSNFAVALAAALARRAWPADRAAPVARSATPEPPGTAASDRGCAAGRSTSTSLSNGMSWCANASSAVAATRCRNSRNASRGVNPAAQHQGIGEEADQRLGRDVGSIGDRRADGNVRLSGIAEQQRP